MHSIANSEFVSELVTLRGTPETHRGTPDSTLDKSSLCAAIRELNRRDPGSQESSR